MVPLLHGLIRIIFLPLLIFHFSVNSSLADVSETKLGSFWFAQLPALFCTAISVSVVLLYEGFPCALAPPCFISFSQCCVHCSSPPWLFHTWGCFSFHLNTGRLGFFFLKLAFSNFVTIFLLTYLFGTEGVACVCACRSVEVIGQSLLSFQLVDIRGCA